MFDTMELETANASGDAVVRMQADLVGLSAEDLAGWTGDAVSGRLVGLLELRERLDAELTRVAGVWQRQRGWEPDGALSPVAWLTHRAPVTNSDAALLVKTAKLVNHAPLLAGALQAGDTTAAHVGVLARVMSPRRQSLLGEHEEVLAEQAGRLSIKDFTLLTRRWATICR